MGLYIYLVKYVFIKGHWLSVCGWKTDRQGTQLTPCWRNSHPVQEQLRKGLFSNSYYLFTNISYLHTSIFKKNQFYLLGLLGLNYHSIGRLMGIYSQQIFVSWWGFLHSAPPFISGEWRRQKKNPCLQRNRGLEEQPQNNRTLDNL